MNYFKFIKIVFFLLFFTNIACSYAIGNVSYEFKQEKSLPTTADQILFCSDDTRAWLEITNYEFLINGIESDKLVTIFIGTKGSSGVVKKESIQIFDPESAFVFQDAILKYCAKNSQFGDTFLDLAKIIQIGYNALDYHFGFKNSLGDVNEITTSINSPQELYCFIKSTYHNTYKTQAESLGRFVTAEDINRKKELGFIAYYPNPFYNAATWHIRPQDINYDDYKLVDYNESLTFNEDGLEFLFKKGIVTEHNEFYDVLKRVYPDKILSLMHKSCPLKDYKDYEYSDIKELTYKDCTPLHPIYLFRGDSRSLEEIFTANGFESEVIRGGVLLGDEGSMDLIFKKYSIDKEKIKKGEYDLEKIMKIDDFWLFPENGLELYSDAIYVSASRVFSVANDYSVGFLPENKKGNVYAFFTKKGIDVPSLINACHETVVPLKVNFTDIVGTRASYIGTKDDYRGQDDKKYLIGPVFLKKDFELIDADNFWKTLHLFGGKNQFKKMTQEQKEQVEKIADSSDCEEKAQVMYEIYGIEKYAFKVWCLWEREIDKKIQE